MNLLTPQEDSWIACTAALPYELAGLRRRMVVEETHVSSEATFYQGRLYDRNLLLVQTGIGRAAAERAAAFILDRYDLGALISFGFAGGLTEQLDAGAVVLCQRLYAEDGRQRSLCSDGALLAAAQAVRVRVPPVLGSSLTVDRMVSRPEEKLSLGETFQAEVLEMESYWIGQACATRGVPFLAVRAVSDGAGQNLPPLERLVGPLGKVRWKTAVRYFVSHPGDLLKVAQFARTVRAAEQQLTAFLIALLQSLE